VQDDDKGLKCLNCNSKNNVNSQLYLVKDWYIVCFSRLYLILQKCIFTTTKKQIKWKTEKNKQTEKKAKEQNQTNQSKKAKTKIKK